MPPQVTRIGRFLTGKADDEAPVEPKRLAGTQFEPQLVDEFVNFIAS